MAGSLGLGFEHEEPWFEYGGRDYEHAWQFLSSQFTILPSGRFDCHVWVEDDCGRVYDIVTPHMLNVASLWGKRVDAAEGAVITGISKGKLAARGLHYLKPTGDASAILLRVMDKGHDYGDAMMDRIAPAPAPV